MGDRVHRIRIEEALTAGGGTYESETGVIELLNKVLTADLGDQPVFRTCEMCVQVGL